MLGSGSVVTAKASKPIAIAPRSSTAESVDALIGYFTDSTYAYRFGPLPHAAVVARLRVEDSNREIVEVRWSALAEALPAAEIHTASEVDGLTAAVVLSASKLARDVRVDCPGWVAEDSYLDLLPAMERKIRLDGAATAVSK